MEAPIGLTFGDGPELSARLLMLVRQGKKSGRARKLRPVAPCGIMARMMR